jgi:hypothetical protein
MTAHWSKPPAEPRKKTTRRPAMRGTWRCRTCDVVLVGSWAAAERHADAHGGARLEAVAILELEPS